MSNLICYGFRSGINGNDKIITLISIWSIDSVILFGSTFAARIVSGLVYGTRRKAKKTEVAPDLPIEELLTQTDPGVLFQGMLTRLNTRIKPRGEVIMPSDSDNCLLHLQRL
jgi:hypothetical protein